MPRSLYPCTTCRERPEGRLASVTIAGRWSGPSRVAYRLRLCMTCYCTKVLPLEPPDDAEVLTCTSCHVDVEGNLEPVFVTSFLPGVGKVTIESPFCIACAIKYREYAMTGEQLQEQPVEGARDLAPSTNVSGTAGWAALGLYPRE